MFIRIVIPEYFDKLYITLQTLFPLNLKISSSKEKILIDHKPSLVMLEQSENKVVKIVKARTWHEYFKLLWGHSRIHKEVYGNRLMAKLGFRVPEVLMVAYRWAPDFKDASLGFYMMENLDHSGFRTVRGLIDENKLSGNRRKEILRLILDGLRKLQKERIVFTDFHLENVMLNDSGELAWMDTGVTTYSILSKEKFIRKNNHTMERFALFYGKDYFTAEEQAMIRALKL